MYKKKQPAEKIECLQEDATHRIEQRTIHGYMEFRLNLNSHYKVHTGMTLLISHPDKILLYI